MQKTEPDMTLIDRATSAKKTLIRISKIIRNSTTRDPESRRSETMRNIAQIIEESSNSIEIEKIVNQSGLLKHILEQEDKEWQVQVLATFLDFVKTETDLIGGANYTISGTSQLMSVPFALHAKVAESVSSPVYSTGYSPELGGYVFMVSADGEHGLVCETIDQGFSSWYNAQNVISNPSNHSENGQNFTDWRVPTRYELAQMYSLKTDIEAVGDSFGTKTYWTSNQSVYSVNGLSEETAWRQNFGTGLQYDNNNISLDGELFVRSVREF